VDHTYLDEKSLKNLEDYTVLLGSAILTLQTLHNLQVKSLEIGIMPEDMSERATSIIWSLRALMKHYDTQLNSALELIGDDFDHESVISRLKEKELVRARAMTRKPKKEIET